MEKLSGSKRILSIGRRSWQEKYVQNQDISVTRIFQLVYDFPRSETNDDLNCIAFLGIGGEIAVIYIDEPLLSR